jgi:hypothetical protein
MEPSCRRFIVLCFDSDLIKSRIDETARPSRRSGAVADPYVALLWVPFYNRHDPVLWGFPFFYWYQLAFVPITALLTWIAYRSTRDDA